MPSYLLSCSCGHRTPVSTAEAGQSIRCVCGASLDVPTLRALRTLERADAAAGARSRGATAWDNRHRVAFVLVLAALCGMGTAGYLATQMRRHYVEPSLQEIEQALESSSPGKTVDVYEDLKKGLESQTAATESAAGNRTSILWGLGISLGCSGLALAAAVVALRWGAKRNR